MSKYYIVEESNLRNLLLLQDHIFESPVEFFQAWSKVKKEGGNIKDTFKFELVDDELKKFKIYE